MANASARPRSGAGPIVASGSKVVLVVSRGPAQTPRAGAVAVPNVTGKTQGEALDHLQEAGLNAQVFNDYNSTVKRGRIVDQFPAAGQMEGLNAEVVLLVSNGPAVETSPTSLPDVVGLAEPDAVSHIEAASLSVEVVREHHPNVAEGTVFAQLPSQASIAAGAKKSNPMLWVWMAVAAVVLIGAGIFAYMSMNSGKPVTVPNVVGMTQAEAQTALTGVGLKVGAPVSKATTKAVPGTVVGQTPAAGSVAQTGSSVQLDLAVKPAPVAVPDVVGLTTAAAQSSLQAATLVPVQKSANSSSVPKDQVISQSPAAGVKVETGSKVTVTISMGPQVTNTVSVPDLVGMPRSEAVSKAEAVGLSVRIVPAYSNEATGNVTDQSPDAGTTVAAGATIGLTVSLGPAPSSSVTVPDVQGETRSDATSALKAKGFTVNAVTWDGTGKPADQVVDQSPKAGDKAEAKSSVVIFVSSGK